jgi:hypothetical protein
MSLTSLLVHHIRTRGPIKTARVSSAQAKGNAKRYSYWGAARYQVRLTADGQPTNAACERASSDRRSERLAERDCEELCDREGRIRVQHIGRLSEDQCRELLAEIGGYDQAILVHDQRALMSAADRPLTLQERLTVWLALRSPKVNRETITRAILDGRAERRGRWLLVREREHWSSYLVYLPYGDARDEREFAAETNQERRRRIIASCGERVAVAGRVLLQQDDYGRLYREWDGRLSVRVVCPSTGAVYWLPVRESTWDGERWVHITTAKAAVAQTFDLREVEYSPVAEA